MIGGLDESLGSEIKRQLEAAGFKTRPPTGGLMGTDPQNICNRGKLKQGVQLEVSRKIRDLLRSDREQLNIFSEAVRRAIQQNLKGDKGINMMIERATISNAEEILVLQKLAYRSEAEIYNDFNIPPLVQTLESIEKDFENQFFLKAVTDGRIIGSVRAFIKGETCYIGRLIVHPNFQNQGIGTELMNEIEKNFSTCHRFELFTGDRSERNLYLYQKLGYKIFKTANLTDQTTIVYLEKKIEAVSENEERKEIQFRKL
jgi:ribosomal protein S18 acetylase RimI-like enzyme